MNKLWPMWELLQAVLILLKLIGKIEWSWWYVFIPVWMPLAFFLFFCLIAGIASLCVRLFTKEDL